MPSQLETATDTRSPQLRTDVLVLVVTKEKPSDPEQGKHLSAEIERINKFRRTGIGWPLTPTAIAINSLDDATSMIREHRPAVVHFRGNQSLPIFGTDLPDDFLNSFS